MRTLVPILTGLGLVVATAASAEPAKLSEGELGRVAAGQMEFNLSTLEAVTTTTTTETTSNVNDNDTAVETFTSDATAAQDLAGQSSNTLNALGLLNSNGVAATGDANAIVSGTVTNTLP